MIDDLDPPLATEAELAACAELISSWIDDEARDNPFLLSHERDPAGRRWLVRLAGEEKDITAVWFSLGQRTLHYETYVMPAPEEQHARLYELLLRWNEKLYGVSFAIGDEDAVYLRGRLAVGMVDRVELDRILGTIFATVERFFRPAMRIGYASRFRG